MHAPFRPHEHPSRQEYRPDAGTIDSPTRLRFGTNRIHALKLPLCPPPDKGPHAASSSTFKLPIREDAKRTTKHASIQEQRNDGGKDHKVQMSGDPFAVSPGKAHSLIQGHPQCLPRSMWSESASWHLVTGSEHHSERPHSLSMSAPS